MNDKLENLRHRLVKGGFLNCRTGARRSRTLRFIMGTMILAVLIAGQIFAADAVKPIISVSYENTPIEAALRDYQEKSGFKVAYRQSLLAGARPVTLTVTDAGSLDVLDLLLKPYGLVGISTNESLVAVVPSTSAPGRQKRFGQALRRINGYQARLGGAMSRWSTAEEVELRIAIVDLWACVILECIDSTMDNGKKMSNYDNDMVIGAMLPLVGVNISKRTDLSAEAIREAYIAQTKDRTGPEVIPASVLQLIEKMANLDWETQNPESLRAMILKLNHALTPQPTVDSKTMAMLEERVQEISKSGNSLNRTLLLATLAQLLPGFAKAFSASDQISEFTIRAFTDPDLTKQVLAAKILCHMRSPEALLELVDANPTRIAGRLIVCDLLFSRFDGLTRAQKDRLYKWVLAQREPAIKRVFWNYAGNADFENIQVLGKAPYQTDFTIEAVAFSSDSRLLALGGHGGVEIWNLESNERVQKIPVKESVYGLEFLESDSKLLFHGESIRSGGRYSNGPPIIIWDLKNGRQSCVGHLPEAPKLPQRLEERVMGNAPRVDYDREWWSGRIHTVSPVIKNEKGAVGQVVLVPAGFRRHGPHLLAWNLTNGKSVEGIMNAAMPKALGNGHEVKVMAFSPDGSRLLTIDWADDSSPGRRQKLTLVSIWSWPARKKLYSWKLPADADPTIASWLPDNKRVIISGSENAFLYDAEDGEVLREFRGAGMLDPSRRRLVLLDSNLSEVLVQSTRNWETELTIPLTRPRGFSWWRHVRISPDGRWLSAAINNHTCLLVDLVKRVLVSPAKDTHLRPPRLEYHAGGRLIIDAGRRTRVYPPDSPDIYKLFPKSNGILSPRGRLFLSQSETSEKSVWDILEGKQLGWLDKSRGTIIYSKISGNGRWCAFTRIGGRRLQFHDLKTNQQLQTFMEMNREYLGKEELRNVIWNSSGKAFVADMTGLVVRNMASKPFGLKPIGFTGCLDPATGTIAFRFKTPDGTTVESVSDMAYSEKAGLVYLNVVLWKYEPLPGGSGSYRVTTEHLPGLWSAEDGRFVRKVSWLKPPKGEEGYYDNWPALFTVDGKWLVGQSSMVEVATGNLVSTYTKGTISPSGTLVAEVKDDVLFLWDTRIGRKVWHVTLDLGFEERSKSVTVAWRPDETQLAICFPPDPTLYVVDLFKIPKLKAFTETLDPHGYARLMTAGSRSRKRAVYGIVQDPELDVKPFGELLKNEGMKLDQKRLIILAMEWRARNGDAAAYDVLKSCNTETGLESELAGSALSRLAAGQRLKALAEEFANPKPFPWIVSEKTKQERLVVTARFDEDGDGKLNQIELQRAAEDMLQSIEAKGITGKWRKYDVNRNGILDAGEREKLLQELSRLLKP